MPISRKKLIKYLKTFPEYRIRVDGRVYIEYGSRILAEIDVDSVDFGAVLVMYDNRAPQHIINLVSYFTYEYVHTNYNKYSSVGWFLVKLLDFKV